MNSLEHANSEPGSKSMATADGSYPKVIAFTQGIPGFPEVHEFELSPIVGSKQALLTLASVEKDGPAFTVLADDRWEKIYGETEIRMIEDEIGTEVETCALLFVIVLEVKQGHVEVFINMRSPIIIDTASRRGLQVVLNSPYMPFRKSIGCLSDPEFPKLV